MALFKNLNFDQKEGEIKQKQTEVEHGGGREGTRRRTKKAKQILIFLEQVNFCKVRNIFYIYTIHSIFSGFFRKAIIMIHSLGLCTTFVFCLSVVIGLKTSHLNTDYTHGGRLSSYTGQEIRYFSY